MTTFEVEGIKPVDELFNDKIRIGKRYPENTHIMMQQGEQYMTEQYSYIRALTPQEQWMLHERICVLEKIIGG